jgi:hypothetical protein
MDPIWTTLWLCCKCSPLVNQLSALGYDKPEKTLFFFTRKDQYRTCYSVVVILIIKWCSTKLSFFLLQIQKTIDTVRYVRLC